MAVRTKTITTIKREPEETDVDLSVQRKRPESAQFRLQVDRQTKSSYTTLEDAEKAGLVIKKGHPTLHVTVYDAKEGSNKVIELSDN
jgi:hypothetical protein